MSKKKLHHKVNHKLGYTIRNTGIIDKWGNSINITKVTIGKLKAILTHMEGIVWRNNKTNFDIQKLIDSLPREYDLIADELKKRDAKPYIPFHWILLTKDRL
jgi:hypothetical protein